MNYTKPYGPRDEASGVEGDLSFLGVEERWPIQSLPDGYVSGARNTRFRNGRAASRGGITLLPWMKDNGLVPFTEVYGGGVFRDPTSTGTSLGEEWILIAADGGIWRTGENRVALEVPMNTAVPLTQETFRKFVQGNGAILLVRGLDTDCLICTDLDEGFKPIAQQNVWEVSFDHATNYVGLTAHNLLVGDPVRFQAGTGALPAAITADKTYYVLDTPNGDAFTISDTPGGTRTTWNTTATDSVVDTGQVTVLDGAVPIPPAEDAIFASNRFLLVVSADELLLTDLGDFTRAQPATNQFRINQGDNYRVVGMAIFNEDTLVVLKSGNVRKVTGVSGDLSLAQGPLNVTDAFGGVAASAMESFGNDIYWVSSEGRVASLRLTELNKEQGTDIALSDPLVQTFGRVNHTYLARARLAVHKGFLYCALPFDDARVLGTELVAGGQSYAGPGVPVVISGLKSGRRYLFMQGTFDGNLVNGTETLTGDQEFVAQGPSVSLYLDDDYTDAEAVMSSIRVVQASGVNTGVAVYDFLNRAWAGSDEALDEDQAPSSGAVGQAVAVKEFLKFNYNGALRLGFIGADGWLHLYDEGYEDDVLEPVTQPYVDLVVDAAVGVGQFMQVNGGTLVTATADDTNQVGGASNWGIGSDAGGNLWRDADGVGGFDPSATNPWSAPNCTVTQIAGGVRFTATNGVAPALPPVLPVSWPLIDAHSGNEIISTPVVSWVRTRGLRCQRQGMKRYLQMAVQLATWGPKYTLRSVTQGVGTAVTQVDGEERDRLKYLAPWDGDDWDPTNINDDYGNPRREDYSFAMTDLGIELGVNGIGIDDLQEYVHAVPVTERGLWMALEVVNELGRLEMLGAAMEAQPGEVLSGPAIA